MNRISLKYGLKAGILLVVLSWASFYITRSSGVTTAQIASIIVILVALGFVPISIHSVRKQRGNFISFWMAFFTGVLTTLVPALLMFISTIIFMIVQRAEYAEWSVNTASQGSTGDSNAVIMHPVEQGVIMFLTVMMLGTLTSLISAILLHRSRVQ
jgi:uncharacterized protein DUF4199